MNKKYVMILHVLGLLVVSSSSLYAQKKDSSWRDTLNHLQYLVVNKQRYIGKPFSLLEKDLEFKIKKFIPIHGLFQNKNAETVTTFYLIDVKRERDYSFPQLLVTWKPYLNGKISDSLFFKDHGKWSRYSDSLYSSQIIGDISTNQ